MRMTSMILAILACCVAAFSHAAQQRPAAQATELLPRSDLCHAYALNVEQGEKLLAEVEALRNPTQAQLLELKAKYATAEQILGEFEAEVAEEELTSKSYPLIGTGEYVTVSVYYTDEMMASRGHTDSMSMGVIVSPKKYDNAITAENSAVAQISYTAATDKVQVKTKTRVNGTAYVVGLECQARVGTFHR